MIEKITIETESYFMREFRFCDEGTIIFEKEDIARLTNNFAQKIYVKLYPESSMLIEVKDDCVVVDFQAFLKCKCQQGVVVKKGEKQIFDEETFTYDIAAKHFMKIE